jgi:transposase
MEPTNYYWMLLASELERRNIDYYLVNAYTVAKRREGDNIDKSKDDPRDAFAVGDLLRTGKYTETRLLHGLYAELRQYASLFHRLRRDIGRQKTLLCTAVGQLFPELTSVFADLTGKTAQAMLQNHAAALTVRQMSQDDFIAAVHTDFRGQRLMVSKLREAHKLAADSVGLVDGTQALQAGVRTYLETLRLLEAQAAQVRQGLLETFYALPEAEYVLSLHGLGAITSATILAEIGDPNNFRNSRQLTKLAGTQPAPNTSGRRTRSLTPMSHQGRPRLRTALYFACLRLIQVNEDFARRYRQLQERDRNPLTKMQALGVLMNKLLRIVWALIRHQVHYDPAAAQDA